MALQSAVQSLRRRLYRPGDHDLPMQDILLVTLPFFALVLCGYLAARLKLLTLDAIPGLNTFVLYFALPCMLFRFGAETPIGKLLDVGLIAVYLLCAAIMVGLLLLLCSPRRLGWNDAAFGALVGAFPNSGFMGIPLMVALMGSAAAGPVIVSITIDMVITSSVCIALSRLGGQGDAGLGRTFLNALRGVVVNPLPWAILLGGLISATDVSLPGPLMETIVMLADAGSPAALFTIGAVLARSRLATIANGDTAGDWLAIARVVLLKLLFHPLLVLAVGHLAIALGAPVDPTALNMLALVAALPAASSIPMLAERYGADTGRIARIVMISTALSFLTFSAGVAWLG